MIKPAHMTFQELRREISRLNIREKSRLVKRLMQETWEERYRSLLKKIDDRLQKSPLSPKDKQEINHIVEQARQEYYSQHAQSRR